jgi:hypothetical protein
MLKLVASARSQLFAAAELDEVVEFVRNSAQRLLGVAVDVFPVSARLALRAKQGDPLPGRAAALNRWKLTIDFV